MRNEHEELPGEKPSVYIKDKRVDFSSFLDSIETDKIVELPADLFTIIDASAPAISKKQKKNKKLADKNE